MSVLVYLIPAALLFGLASLIAFLWALKSGQYEDLDGAGERILIETEPQTAPPGSGTPAAQAYHGARSAGR